MYRAERELNRVFEALLSALNRFGGESEEGANLRLTQFAWLVFRELDCKQFEGGTATSTFQVSCIAQHAIARAKRLGYWLEELEQ
jgi:uncharacterized protein YecT (DUF1311 family)